VSAPAHEARLPLAQARRLALHAQGLAGPAPRGTAGPAEVAAVTRRIGCLQLDPVSAVARSPLLVLHARLGRVDEPALEAAAYRDRVLFDFWAHEASHCHVDDLPLHRWQMRRYLHEDTIPRARARAWMAANAAWADGVVADLAERGPLRARELEDRAAADWRHGHWTDEVSSRQNVARMLDRLWMSGRIGIAGRAGTERLWDVLERCLPPGALAAADAAPLTDAQATRRAALRALAMLGVARVPHIRAHFTRGRYPGLESELAALEAEGAVARVEVEGLRGTWWVRPEDLERAPDLPEGRRTVALSPFDNVLCDRARTAELFGFDHRLEIYVPAPQRRWGYYVLPILHGERLVARADLRLDRAARLLRVLSLHHEPGRRAPGAVRVALERLAAWRGATLDPA
jgi:uncharacterized protein YcaQ